MHNLSLDICSLQRAYAEGKLTPTQLVEEVCRRTEADPNKVWIQRLPDEVMRQYASTLMGKNPAELPLYGIPFAIKDNIDLAGVPTTAGCREFAYTPAQNAFVVQRLIDAGAIPIGKTNLDQFATGLNGTRSPWGACRNAFDPDYISGGSSSGSAVAVALGYCSFALGTDTAGSGRVPAAFNNIVGHKPSLGWLSASGLVPACRSLDTISIFAQTAEDAETITTVAARFDAADAYSRQVQPHAFDFGKAPTFRLGVPQAKDLQFFGNADAQRLFKASVEKLQTMGAELVEIDFAPFLDTARLLYDGPWVAERYAAIREFFDAHAAATLPVIQTIIGGARQWSAADAYEYSYKLKAQQRMCAAVWSAVDCIITPTAGTIYTIEQMLAEPIKLNSNLGYYTNFMNLLDYAATAVPAGFLPNGLPFGITLFAPAHQDGPLLHLAAKLQRASVNSCGLNQDMPAICPHPALPSAMIKLAVCGAHMQGLPLNWQLTQRHARLLQRTRTTAEYRLYALAGGSISRPGMVRVANEGRAIEVEVWEMPGKEFGSFVAGIPAPLGIGTLQLEDGSSVQGFVCESVGTEGAKDISHYGGWRCYLADAESISAT